MVRDKARRYTAVFLIVISLCSVCTQAIAESVTLYRETYNHCSGTVGKDSGNEVNWIGLVSGRAQERISNLKSVSYGSDDVGGSVNSLPIGLSEGYAFWFKPVNGLTIFTAEFQFDVGILRAGDTSVEYLQRLSGVSVDDVPNKTHLAFLVDDTWYISQAFARQEKVGVWEQVSFAPGILTYGMTPYIDGLGPVLPTTFTSPLPAAGTVRAFGVFLDEVNGRVRLDNFMIKGTAPSDGSISTEVQEPDVSLCPEGSPDRAGEPGQDPPSDDEGDVTPDHNDPGDSHPEEDPTGYDYVFCPIKQQGRGRLVSLSREHRAKLIRSISDSSLSDLRDRAIIRLFARRRMKMGSLVNVKVGDYDPDAKVLSLGVRPKSKPQRIKVGRVAAKALEEYLFFPGAPSEANAPLFIREGIQAAFTTTVEALCKPDVRSMLMVRGRSARIRIGDITVK
jgi:hypothetical protein